ncbi:beta strand repeat-containing protein [Photobacterium galatheae]|uniref:beta strand repeat-containing protein n=1 Tax=Photobacterium galatheae TaxID=1654360 RepID=UPI00055E6505|nr:Ig-like domain-containing protein [Photobacterium galatheae]MCM0151427.1 Ig-like domain-containing protein [Photobacterium galatheae]
MNKHICHRIRQWLGYFLMVLVLALAGCGGDGSGLPSQKDGTGATLTDKGGQSISALNIIPDASSVEAGNLLNFIVEATYSNDETVNVTAQAACVSSDVSIAAVSEHGVLQGVAAGEATISCDYSGINVGGLVISVTGGHTVKQLQITPGVSSVAEGTQVQFTALAFYHDGTREDVTAQVVWSSSVPGVATIDVNGTATADTSGVTEITGTLNGIASNIADLTVTAASLVSLEITPSSLVLAVGTEQQLKVIGRFSDGTTQDLTAQVSWNSSDLALATVSEEGLLVALLDGAVTVSANLNGVNSDGVLITINNPTLEGLQITPGNLNLAKGTSQLFTAIASYSDGTTQDVTSLANWVSSDTAVADMVLIGTVQALDVGTATISATFMNVDSNLANVNVTPETIQSIIVDPLLPASIANGTTQQYQATALFSDGSTADVTAQVNWLSDDTSIATISATGLAQGVGEGNTVISAHLQGVDSADHLLNVTAAVLTALDITPLTANLAKGTTEQLNAIATFSDGSTQDVTNLVSWESSAPNVATVDPSGLVQSLDQGATDIVAQYLTTLSDPANLTVTPETITSLDITPAVLDLANGLKQQLQAIATFTDGSTQDVTELVNWLSSNTAVATVTSGLVQGLSEGAVNITGQYDGTNDTTALNVTAAEVDRVRVESDHLGDLNIQLLGSSIFDVYTKAYFTDGTSMVIDNSNVAYFATESSLLTVNTDGVVTVKAGVLSNEQITSTATIAGADIDSENAININCVAALPPLASICSISSVELSN